ncbi:helix-turn-helix transcriptional regulator [Bacillus sp. T3]|uniref:helix-turn-helix domain-containing protein n=1 Tax=Bacillus sp. T3 TaxID=467262 RepID=UPI0029816F08|nr:helix-turn-helix transcriptional regulator [Bacillus sp. T3]
MLGKQIKNLREQHGYSITELAKLANVSKSYLSLIERDIKKNPSLLFLDKMAKTLNTNIEYLLGTDMDDKQKNRNSDLDNDWTDLILLAINSGACKVEFRNYLDTIKCQKNKKQGV